MRINLNQLLSSEKFLHVYTKRTGENSTKLPPVAVELHWTSSCNYKCVHCSYGNRRKNSTRLSAGVIQSIIDDLIELKTEAVYLSGGGEPTTVKDWQRYAKKLIENNIEVALITNGIAIREDSYDVLR
ncbi:MAG: radical SAM protein, partial [Nitrospiraceae bacterium]|nr:radical SAM protein [Nitrospiraceae bacterium]